MSLYPALPPLSPHLVVVMKMLSIQFLHSFLEFLGLQDELGGVVQPRLHGTQLHFQVMYLREGGVELQRTKMLMTYTGNDK